MDRANNPSGQAGGRGGRGGGFGRGEGRGGGDRGLGRGRGDRGGRGGRGRGERGGRGDRGRGRGGRGGRGGEPEEWVPFTKLGRLVNAGKIQDLHQIYLHSLPIKEAQIIDKFINAETLKDELMRINPVQKQTNAGQRTRFKAVALIGDHHGHVGVGVKVAKEVASAISGATTAAKLSIVPIRLGYWGNNIGNAHTVAMKVTGKCGSVTVRLIPAPRGTGLVAAPVSKKLLSLSGVEDVFTSSVGKTKTMPNFVKATFFALRETYRFLTPNLWPPHPFPVNPYQEFSQFLLETAKPKPF